jgi:hypothetical protein
MAKACNAIAASTGDPCRRRPLLWSRYCLFHTEKTQLLVSAVLGAILSLIFALCYRSIVPSDEAAALARIEGQLEPFLTLAASRYPDMAPDDALQRLQNDLESVRRRTTSLERRVEPRSLSPQQQLTLEKALRAMGPREIQLTAVLGDQEAISLAKQLESVFKRAGWTTSGVNQTVFAGPVMGLLLVTPSDPAPAAVMELFRALHSSGLKSTGDVNPGADPEKLAIIVGAKR